MRPFLLVVSTALPASILVCGADEWRCNGWADFCTVPVGLDTGELANEGDEARVIFTEPVSVPGASYLSLHFSVVRLASGSRVRLTEVATGISVSLAGRDLEQSPWTVNFQGDTVLVDVVLAARTGVQRVVVDSVDASPPDISHDWLCFRVDVFRRGDANADGVVDLSDAITILMELFGPCTRYYYACPDAYDANDDGEVDISDAVTVLQYLFGGAVQSLPPPFPECGQDPTVDDLQGNSAHCLYYGPGC